MAITHSTTARNAAANSVVNLIGASGRLVFRTAGTLSAPGTPTANLPFSATAFGVASNGTATANPITSELNAVGNTADSTTATLETSAGTIIIHCSVANTGGDINMTGGISIAAGDVVTCSSLTYTALGS